MPEHYEEPGEYCYTILQDHGPNDGGWGPAAIAFIGEGSGPPTPIMYTGTDERTILKLEEIASMLAEETGKPTRFCRFGPRYDIAEAP